MSATDGSFSPRKLFGAIELTGDLTTGRLLWLLSLGVAIAVLEHYFRWPLQLPGRHGLDVMALLMLARLSCRTPWSATITATGTAVAAPVLGADHGLLMPLLYLLPGALLDLGFRLRPRAGRFVYLPLVAALAWASKPAVKLLASLGLGMQFDSLLRVGAAYPILTHLLFGFVGGLSAVLLWRATERASRR